MHEKIDRLREQQLMEMTTLIECGLERIEALARQGCATPTPAPGGMVVIAGIVLILALMRKR